MIWPRPGAACQNSGEYGKTMGYQRRTTRGKGRTKKPGLQGTVKNPRLLLACITSWEESDM
jgi:hypothetical protein